MIKIKKNHVRWAINVIRPDYGKPAHTVLEAETYLLQDCASQYSVYKLDSYKSFGSERFDRLRGKSLVDFFENREDF